MPKLRRVVLPVAISTVLVVGLTVSAQATPTWVAVRTLSTAGETAVANQVAVNAAGDAVAVWQVQDSFGDWRVQAAHRRSGGHWSTYQTLSAAGESGEDPHVAIDDAGNAVAIWERADRIQAARMTAAGSWSAPVRVSATGTFNTYPKVAVDGHGVTTALWATTTGSDYRIQVAHRTSSGAWSAPQNVTPIGLTLSQVQLATNRAGTVVATWLRYNGTKYVTQVARRPAGGSWSAIKTLTEQGEYGDEPHVAVDRSGTATAVWVASDGIDHWIVAARQTAGGSWSAQHLLSDNGAPADQPQLAVDAAGDAFVVWRRSDGSNDRIQEATRAAGEPWSTPTYLSELGQDALRPDVAADPRGDAIAAWARNDGNEYQLQASTRPKGSGWSTPAGTLYPSNSHSVDTPRIAMDPQGNAAIAWLSYDSNEEVVRASGFDFAGPTARITKPKAALQQSRSFPVAWSAHDVWSKVANKDVRYRAKPHSGTFGAWVNWKTDTTASSATFTGKRGSSYCFEVRATDTVGNVGAWSAKRCTTVSQS